VEPLLTFREGDAARWIESFGHLTDGAIPWGLHGITRSQGGRADLAGSAAMSVGIYVVVDSWSRVLYLGKVSRQLPDAISQRISHHHRLTPDWDAVWLLPLAERTPHETVLRLEALMISAYRPPLNIQHAGQWL